MDKGKSRQPPWAQPKTVPEEPVLSVWNSMTRSKDVFVPMSGRTVKWYNCGPTVYDSSHLGHARNYVTQDILRRIMVDYFGYDVHFVMNITDIDDKIIQRARYKYLTTRFRNQSVALSPELISSVDTAFSVYIQSKLAKSLSAEELPAKGSEQAGWPKLYESFKSDPAWVKAHAEKDEKFSMHFNSLNSAFVGLQEASKAQAAGTPSQEGAASLIDSSLDILGPWLDDQFKAEVTDHEIFRSLAAYWEDSFMSDMARLHVLSPDTLTRVTEYVPEIVAYVERIISNGYAYPSSDGSVYFDTGAFDGKGKEEEWSHSYAKLMPWNKGNKELLEEGEGALSSASGSAKRASADFALWKASKPGEPAWPSPWGPGRPGWHIECSVMATEILGDSMDIHSGGIDLAFPHHDNEIAQSEAYHDCRQWVNYFLHTGHLHIEGLKMSKSLKNFITIEQALNTYTPRQLRLVFLGQLWNAKFDFRDTVIAEAKATETTFENFFVNVKALIAEAGSSRPTDTRHHYDQAERELTASLHKTRQEFRAALSDSFNTPEALKILLELVSKTNQYLSRGRKDLNIGVIRNVATWVTKMLRMFGLGEGAGSEGGVIGWGRASASGTAGGGDEGSFDRDTVLMPYLTALSTFRDDVRRLARNQAPAKDLLALCDKLRDADLAPLGVALDDQEDGKALVKLVDPSILLRAREEKAAIAAEKAAKKAAQVAAEQAKRLAKLEKGKTPPEELFKPPNVPEGTYGEWDENGVPTKDGQGVELPKSRVKKITKEWEGQKKAHAEWVAYLASEASGEKP